MIGTSGQMLCLVILLIVSCPARKVVIEARIFIDEFTEARSTSLTCNVGYSEDIADD